MRAGTIWSRFTQITFVAAGITTGVGSYAEGVDGARHLWIPIITALWLMTATVGIRDQLVARHERTDAKLYELARDMEDLRRTLGEFAESVREYGDQRQISGHMGSLDSPTERQLRRAVGTTFAGTSSNVRRLQER